MSAIKRLFAVDIDRDVREVLDADRRAPADAEVEFDALDRRFNEALEERQGIELAIAIAAHGEHPNASQSFLAKADRYRKLAEKPARATARLEELDELVEDLRPKRRLALDRRQVAREERAIALAAEFKPRHAKAVRAIGSALEALSVAVAEEQNLHAEFQQQMPGFALLPDFGGLWRRALLNNPRSEARMWVRAAQAAGYIDE